MILRQADLILAVLGALALVALDAAASPPAPARVALGVPFVLVLPGYALVAAIFPRKNDLDFLQRIALSVGLSAAVIPLLGLALNYSPWGIRPHPTVIAVGAFTVLLAVVAAARRQLVPRDQAFRPSPAVPWRRFLPANAFGRALAAAAVLLFVTLTAAGAYLLTAPRSGEAYTEFYLLSAGGRARYPDALMLGERARLTLAVANHEGRAAGYRIVAKVGGAIAGEVSAMRLKDGQSWEQEVEVLPNRAGDGQKVEYLLYREGVSEPYRRLHLWLDVRDYSPSSADAVANVPAPAVAGESATPEPTPEPTPAPEPPPEVHVVSRGEYLTLIAADYGVTLEQLLSVNNIDDPDLIYPRQRIQLPSGAAEGR